MPSNSEAASLRGKTALALVFLLLILLLSAWLSREPAVDAVETPAPIYLPQDDDDPKLDLGVSRSSIEKRKKRRERIQSVPLD